jgi:hypothetical protein
MLTFLKRLAASVPTPSSGKATIFIDSASGVPKYKDDAGNVTPFNAVALNIQTVASATTVTPTSANDQVSITAQSTSLALANPSGTMQDGWGIVIRIKDDGTARSISYGSQYRVASGFTLPTTTVIGTTHYLACIWNAADSKLDVVGVGAVT